MARIRYLAFLCADPAKLADFYRRNFGMEEMGRNLLCAPYFSTAVLAAGAILNAGSEAQKAALLPNIAKGARLAALAITEPDGNWDPAGIGAAWINGVDRDAFRSHARRQGGREGLDGAFARGIGELIRHWPHALPG